MIHTHLRSQDDYNKIPFIVRNKNPKHFKLSYKKYLFGLTYKPRIIKNNITQKYSLVWPGE